MPSPRSAIERAKLLAASDRYGGWREIEAELVRVGWPEISAVLAERRLQQMLDRACADARRAPRQR